MSLETYATDFERYLVFDKPRQKMSEDEGSRETAPRGDEQELTYSRHSASTYRACSEGRKRGQPSDSLSKRLAPSR